MKRTSIGDGRHHIVDGDDLEGNKGMSVEDDSMVDMPRNGILNIVEEDSMVEMDESDNGLPDENEPMEKTTKLSIGNGRNTIVAGDEPDKGVTGEKEQMLDDFEKEPMEKTTILSIRNGRNSVLGDEEPDKGTSDEKEQMLEDDFEVVIDTGHSGGETDGQHYWHRLFHTICVCASLLSLGWSFGIMGPALPDLRLIMNEDLTTASWLWSGWSFGGLIGAVVGGFAYDRFHKIRLFVAITLGMGVSVAAAPWCEPFPAMFLVHVLIGIFGGAIKTAATADVATVWQAEARTFMQVLHTMLCLGAFMSPFTAAPFLAQKLEPVVSKTNANFTSNNSTSIALMSMANISSLQEMIKNLTLNKSLVHEFANMTGGLIRDSTQNNSVVKDMEQIHSDEAEYGETRIHIPYFISGGVCLIAALMFVLVSFIYGNVYDNLKFSTKGREPDTAKGHMKQYFLSKRWKNIFTILVSIAMTLYIMSERGFTQFQMTFIITALKWSKTDGSNASSVFWISFTVGRIISIFIVKKLKLPTILSIYLLSLTCAGGALWVAVVYDVKLLVWISIGATGFSMAPMFGTLFVLVAEKIRTLTGKVSGFCFFVISAAGTVVPIIVGYLMEHVSDMWFIYFELLLYVCLICCITFIFVLYFYLEKKHKK